MTNQPSVPSPSVDKTDSPEAELDLSNPYVDLLHNTNFVASETLTDENLENVPEYLVLKEFEGQDRLSVDDIEKRVDHPLAPVSLKNLTEAEILIQNGDFYQLSDEAKMKLS